MRQSLPFIYLGINVACALVVLYAVHRVVAQMAAEQRTVADFGDSLCFEIVSAPAFLLALLTNLAWVGKALADAWRRRGYQAFVWLAAVAAVWVVAIVGARLV